MKTAGRVLGALVIAMLIAVIALTFVSAKQLITGASLGENTGGGLYDALSGGLSAVLMLLGMAGYIIINILGAVLIVYLICFCVSYGKLYKAKSNASFIRYSAITAGVILFFCVLLFAFNPSGAWRLFLVAALYSGLMIAYAAVAGKYLKQPVEGEPHGDDRYDEPPHFEYEIDILKK